MALQRDLKKKTGSMSRMHFFPQESKFSIETVIKTNNMGGYLMCNGWKNQVYISFCIVAGSPKATISVFFSEQ